MIEALRAIDVLKKLEEHSEDPHTQVGCIITDEDYMIISVGTNTMPNNTKGLPWNREGEYLDTKYPYVVHAEMNAVVNYAKTSTKLKPYRAYVSLFPCVDCLKILIQAGVEEVVYVKKSYPDKDFIKAAEVLAEEAHVSCIELHSVDMVYNKNKNLL